jgi:hypothetical protein
MVRSFLALVRSSLPFPALVALVATSSGCSAIGLGIGAAIPRFDVTDHEIEMRVTDGQPSPLPAVGDDTRVWVTWREDVWAKGLYQGVRDGEVIVSNDKGEYAIALGAISEMRVVRRVRVRRGSYWLTGLAMGAVIDALVLVALYQSSPDPFTIRLAR